MQMHTAWLLTTEQLPRVKGSASVNIYYNEFDPVAAEWLRCLMLWGLIPFGDVDERSIVDVQPDDLKGYDQCHFFVGIGGWSYALHLAGWGDRPVWTGSCPCQPFSTAGKQKGEKDERHLWPEFFRLIAQCRPSTVFGEQVASKLGREWLAGVFADLESVGYAAAGADLCAAGVGAPHIRQRLWWVADAGDDGRQPSGDGGYLRGVSGASGEAQGEGRQRAFSPECGGERGGLGDADDAGSQERGGGPEQVNVPQGREDAQRQAGLSSGAWDSCIWLPCADGKARRIEPRIAPLAHGVSGRVAQLRGLGNAIVPQVAAAFIEAFLTEKGKG